MKVICASVLTCSNRNCGHRYIHERDSIDGDSCDDGLNCEWAVNKLYPCEDAKQCLRAKYGCIKVGEQYGRKAKCYTSK